MQPDRMKDTAHKLIDALPEDATWDDLMYAVHVRASAEEGLADADAGRVISNADLRRSFGLEPGVEE
jgi:predicted transcriptional regulator